MSLSPMHLVTRFCAQLTGTRSAVRRRGRRDSWAVLAVAAVIGGSLPSCSAGPPRPPAVSAQSTASTTLSPPSLSDPSSAAGSTPSSSIQPPGTVVPFRTVAPDSAVGKRIGLVAPTSSDPFAKAVTDSVVAQVTAAGAKLIRCDPGDDATLVLDCARRMATEHVDGWIVRHPGNLGDALCGAGPRDVPLIAIAAAPVSCQTAGVGADDQQAGFLVGAELGRTSRSRSACAHDAFVIVTNSAADVVSADRIKGIRAGFTTQCPQPTSNEQLLDAGTQDRAYRAFTTVLGGLPDDADILVAAVNDGAALGVVAAIPARRAEHITMAAIGADTRARCEILANPRWIGDAALFPDRYGEVAVPALLDALHGQEVPRVIHVRTTFLTAQTMTQFYDVGDCPGQ